MSTYAIAMAANSELNNFLEDVNQPSEMVDVSQLTSENTQTVDVIIADSEPVNVEEPRSFSTEENVTPVPPKNTARQVYKFQVVWDPVKHKKQLGNDIRHHVVIAPYRGENRAKMDIHQAEFPESSGLAIAVEKLRSRGIPVVTGCWKHWENPLAILFDIDRVPLDLVNKYCYEINRDHSIDIPLNDVKCRQAITLSYAAVEFLIQFELAIGIEALSKKSWVRFHDWTGAAGVIFLQQWFGEVAMNNTFLISKTRLGELIPDHPVQANEMSIELKVNHRYALELVATDKATRFVIAKNTSEKLTEKQLFRRPEHRVRDTQAQWWLNLKHVFAKKNLREINRMREALASTDEHDAYDDLKVIKDVAGKVVKVRVANVRQEEDVLEKVQVAPEAPEIPVLPEVPSPPTAFGETTEQSLAPVTFQA